MSIAIHIENVSKIYRLGQVGTGTLSHDLNRWWAKLRGRQDPYQQIGAANNREEAGGDYVWAVRDINFEVEQGQILGIIGRNGAGKSTLLKLLSRVTAPTTGSIRIKGRMASLLEVGTGFHPELTGRENIYLNGAILGMTRPEIRRQFDNIVDFSGCAKYVDTPVKRYSSGMYVRLAFAVAAHLESEVLIVDEVLAVGDAEFQQRCLGRMKFASQSQGRTVLFVSHNMSAVKSLCGEVVCIDQGRIAAAGSTHETVRAYLSEGDAQSDGWISSSKPRLYETGEMAVRQVVTHARDGQQTSYFEFTDPVRVTIRFERHCEPKNAVIEVLVTGPDGTQVAQSLSPEHRDENDAGDLLETSVTIQSLLQPGEYRLTVGIHEAAEGNTIDWVEDAAGFTVHNGPARSDKFAKWPRGFVSEPGSWAPVTRSRISGTEMNEND